MIQAELFAAAQELPSGLLYCPDFLTRHEEIELLSHIQPCAPRISSTP